MSRAWPASSPAPRRARKSDRATPCCGLCITRSGAGRIIAAWPIERSTEAGNVLAFPQAPDAIELRHLRAFVAVAEELSFSRAADRLHISQSALSRQVSSLEKLIGCDLLRRSTHRVELTLAGEALLERTHACSRASTRPSPTTQSVGGELAFRLAQYWAPVFATAEPGISLADRRAAIEGLFAQFPPPDGIEVEPVNAGGVAVVSDRPRPDRAGHRPLPPRRAATPSAPPTATGA